MNQCGLGNKGLTIIRDVGDNDIIKAVDEEYKRIKGRCTLPTPAMGEYGSIEFAGALLLWRYCRRHLMSNMNMIGELMISLGETIGCAYNCMPPGEWSDKIDKVIYNNDFINYTEWNGLYNYLKTNFADGIHTLEFNKGQGNRQQLRERLYQSFVKEYNSMHDYEAVYEYYSSVEGLRLKEDMPFAIIGP